MTVTRFSVFSFALAAPVILVVGSAAADPVCYRYLDNYSDSTRIVLDVKPTSRLTARQVVFEADGKHSFLDAGKNRMAVFDGAVVTSRGTAYQPKGAHLGGESYWVRGANPKAAQGGPASPIVWDCTTAEV